MGRLEGKVALITGAGEGMGRAAAILFAREGAKVGVVDSVAERAAETVELVEGDAIAIAADVSSSEQIEEAVARVVRELGGLHVLYNNAGVWLPGDGAATEMDEEIWHRTLAVNLTGVWLCCRFGIRELIRGGGGSVINTASPVAVRPEAVYDAYVASKGGVISLTKSLAQYYARDGVRVNTLMPGSIETAMTRDSLAVREYREHSERFTILGRLGAAEEVAQAALFLASDESSFVTGSILWADGGWMLGPQTDTFSAV
jgi:NAD(P)-dependent dehydrogenase (short-subunit alcohol dehydrogenase family)